MNVNYDLVKACLFALDHNLCLRATDSILIVTDGEKQQIGDAFYRAALTVTDRVEIEIIPVLEHSGQEPPLPIAEKMRRADVVALPLSKSLLRKHRNTGTVLSF